MHVDPHGFPVLHFTQHVGLPMSTASVSSSKSHAQPGGVLTLQLLSFEMQELPHAFPFLQTAQHVGFCVCGGGLASHAQPSVVMLQVSPNSMHPSPQALLLRQVLQHVLVGTTTASQALLPTMGSVHVTGLGSLELLLVSPAFASMVVTVPAPTPFTLARSAT
jgi:hypothetical protein